MIGMVSYLSNVGACFPLGGGKLFFAYVLCGDGSLFIVERWKRDRSFTLQVLAFQWGGR